MLEYYIHKLKEYRRLNLTVCNKVIRFITEDNSLSLKIQSYLDFLFKTGRQGL